MSFSKDGKVRVGRGLVRESRVCEGIGGVYKSGYKLFNNFCFALFIFSLITLFIVLSIYF